MRRILILAGEPSGDLLGGALMSALHEEDQYQFYGVGGVHMQKQGLVSLGTIDEIAVMGPFIGIGVIRRLYGVYKKLVDLVAKKNPTVLVTIDYPGFNLFIARKLKKRFPFLKHVHYVAPTVWAWRSHRAKRMAAFVDEVLTLFPFEPPFFSKEGIKATFVGHPLVERIPVMDYAPSSTILLLPGSRRSEVKAHAEVFFSVAERLYKNDTSLSFVLPTFSHLEMFLPKNPAFPLTITRHMPKQAKAALAASGTVALELALHSIPMVIGYKISKFMGAVVRSLIKVPYVCMVNILLNKPIIPELLQEDFTVETIYTHMNILLYGEGSVLQSRHFSTVRKMLQKSDKPPSLSAARAIASYFS